MTAEALWATEGWASLAEPLDVAETIFAINRALEPVLIEAEDAAELPELRLP